jgi:hypothetical protein
VPGWYGEWSHARLVALSADRVGIYRCAAGAIATTAEKATLLHKRGCAAFNVGTEERPAAEHGARTPSRPRGGCKLSCLLAILGFSRTPVNPDLCQYWHGSLPDDHAGQGTTLVQREDLQPPYNYHLRPACPSESPNTGYRSAISHLRVSPGSIRMIFSGVCGFRFTWKVLSAPPSDEARRTVRTMRAPGPPN